ncbi:YceI family protein [Seonamhaeicola sp. ML3]|uniref:YceI family protein n=1 Tax=Seonamhaeicola sp. ML3 TaxID=2937786 RepID=UPI00200D5698|nr:YceI family protein [Seonamhaeicola sp. ML3]
MRYFLALYLILTGISASAQSKYLTKTGTVDFEASVPSFEEVKATNNSVTAIINTENGEFAALVLVKGFRFKNALMEEHFNENYAESDTYPKATFKGKITDFVFSNLTDTDSTFKYNGELSFHGKTKSLKNLDLLISKNGDLVNISGSFMTKASDFDIEIPKIVNNKIAEEIEISFNFELKKK